MKTKFISLKTTVLGLAAFLVSNVSLFAQTARLQIIHNASDTAARFVDVYLNDNLLINDFAFRTATSYINAPAGVSIKISISPKTSTSSVGSLADFNVTLTPNGKYVAIASGLVAPGYATNPNGRSTGFTLLLKDGVRETANLSSNVDFIVAHGSTDAPFVDVEALGVAKLVNNAGYSDITNYITVPAAAYTLNVKDSSGANIVATYKADLSTLGGQSAVIFASGFLTPSSNKLGRPFGLFAALANGTVIALGPGDKARLQVIHNSADPAASSVDIYLNGVLLLNNFNFRTASPYIDAPAGIPISIAVAPSTSTSVSQAIATFTPTLTPGLTYVALATGLIGTGFAANPYGISRDFTLLLVNNAKETAPTNKVDFVVVHGATDAPGVDVLVEGGPKIVNNAKYKDVTGYISVANATYILNVKDSTSTTTVGRFNADLTGIGGKSAIVFASGFLIPTANKNGAAFGLFAALPDGRVVPFSLVTGINDSYIAFASLKAFPIPASEELTLDIESTTPEFATVYISDISGKSVYEKAVILTLGSNSLKLPISTLSSGSYLLKVAGNNKVSTLKFTK